MPRKKKLKLNFNLLDFKPSTNQCKSVATPISTKSSLTLSNDDEGSIDSHSCKSLDTNSISNNGVIEPKLSHFNKASTER